MSEMVERIARAICVNRQINPDARVGNGEPSLIYTGNSVGYVVGETLPAWRFFVEDALSALAAMREPTKAMELAGQVDPSPVSTDEVWRAMIDAALK